MNGCPSSAQRCLSITEILDLICAEIWYFRNSDKTPSPSHTLAILARSCHTWSEVALNRLWHNIPGITPLLQCLDLWTIENGVFVFKRLFKDSDRAILNKYARRVRELSDPVLDEDPASHYTLSLLSDGCILPNLKTLHWKIPDPSRFRYIRHYLNPRLEELHVSFDIDYPEQLDILFTIPVVFSANLHCLRISSMPSLISKLKFNERLSCALSAWSQLSALEVPDITFEGLTSVAKMNHLKKLKIYQLRSLWVCSDVGAVRPSRQEMFHKLTALGHPFPALQNLHLYTQMIPMAYVTDLFRIFECARLKRLNLRFDDLEDTTSDLDQLVRTLLGHCDPQSLDELWFSHKHLPGSFSNLIQPLLGFTGLRILWIIIPCPISLSVEQATQIVKSLPKLEDLSIDGAIVNLFDEWSDGINTPLNPLTMLIPFAKCRKLKHLCISLDASDKDARDYLRKQPHGFSEIQNLTLQRLTVGYSPISHKEFVASFLSDIFPNLQEITFSCVETSYIRRWTYVEEILLPMLRRTREGNYRRMGIEIHNPPRDWTSNWGRQMSVLLTEEDVEWSDEEGVDSCRGKLATLRNNLLMQTP